MFLFWPDQHLTKAQFKDRGYYEISFGKTPAMEPVMQFLVKFLSSHLHDCMGILLIQGNLS
jgi:hypothetical protein